MESGDECETKSEISEVTSEFGLGKKREREMRDERDERKEIKNDYYFTVYCHHVRTVRISEL